MVSMSPHNRIRQELPLWVFISWLPPTNDSRPFSDLNTQCAVRRVEPLPKPPPTFLIGTVKTAYLVPSSPLTALVRASPRPWTTHEKAGFGINSPTARYSPPQKFGEWSRSMHCLKSSALTWETTSFISATTSSSRL